MTKIRLWRHAVSTAKVSDVSENGKPLIFKIKEPKNTRNGRPGGTMILRNVGNYLPDDMA